MRLLIAPEGEFVILTRFDPDKPQQREHMLALIPRFLAWKLATAFVLTAEEAEMLAAMFGENGELAARRQS